MNQEKIVHNNMLKNHTLFVYDLLQLFNYKLLTIRFRI